MGWLQQLCRNTGLMLHNIAKPIKDDAKEKTNAKVIKHEVEEETVGENLTLRRTTIEEIEITDKKQVD